jgi:anti-anti-sigma regulatory factor
MVSVNNTLTIEHGGAFLSAAAAKSMMQGALASREPRTVVVDLQRTSDTSTAALATLVLFRGALLKAGGDLRLCGLHGRAKSLYEVHRMNSVLPRQA